MKRRNFLKKLFVFPVFLLPFELLRKQPAPQKFQTLSFELPIAGFQYYKGEKVWKKLRKNAPLRLKREPQNPFDSNAIEVFWKNKKLGYIPRADNSLLAQLLNRNYPVKAQISLLQKSRNPWDRVEVRVEIGLWESRA